MAETENTENGEYGRIWEMRDDLKIRENEESGNIWELVENEHIPEMREFLYFGKIGKWTILDILEKW